MLSLTLKSEITGEYSIVVSKILVRRKKKVPQMIVDLFVNGESRTFSNETD